ncbi:MULTISPECIES: LemA family protein [Solidesulfovibrio]|uniref:LemA family protein n=2 Tax=Solidesulfovibrio TaxID=2910984 RepID=C4XPN1_SOLM1|nr:MULTISPECIES: LemA family protein [Solidesulfovibrio]QAZ67135.1 LemA family protein [Solidesulfovibrio carbinolicus]BAH75211.1 LemA family protein [Solidesulfovibrio magneticus RS-1]
MNRLLAALALVVALFGLTGCGYNEMQTNDEAVKAAWGNVEATLQRRLDLIPNLVETVKGYASHEKDTLTAVTEARAKATQIKLTPETLADPKAMAAFQQAQGQMQSALSRLLAVAENYPQLKADQNFRDLQHQLEGTENRINVARQRYNEAVQIYNSSIRTFPNSMTNSMLLHLAPKEYYKADDAAQQAPKVKF